MKLITTILFSLSLFLLTHPAQAQSGGGYTITHSTIDGGGLIGVAGGDYTLSGTAGQPDVGLATGGGYRLQGGFWHAQSAGVPTVVQLSDGATLHQPQQRIGVLLLVLVCLTGITLNTSVLRSSRLT